MSIASNRQATEGPSPGGPPGDVMIVKKYSNRRLYDTHTSRYITLEELTEKIRSGEEVRVVDAKSGEDITQATLAQVVVESRGAAKLLPIPLLTQLIRMGDDALAEFFGQYMFWFFEIYLQLKQGVQAASPFNPFSFWPFGGASPFGRAVGGAPSSTQEGAPEAAPTTAENSDEIARLRREMEALREEIRRGQNSDE